MECGPVGSPYLEKVASTIPHDLFHRGIGEDMEDRTEACGACSECEDVKDEDVLCVSGSDAHEGEEAVYRAEVLALAVDNEEG